MEKIWYVLLTAVLLDALLVFLIVGVLGKRVYKFRLKRRERSWTTMELGSELHVLPQLDIVEHRLVDCACSPKRFPGRVPDNEYVFWTVQHNAADGRKTVR